VQLAPLLLSLALRLLAPLAQLAQGRLLPCSLLPRRRRARLLRRHLGLQRQQLRAHGRQLRLRLRLV
jgi:hypothetical protein